MLYRLVLSVCLLVLASFPLALQAQLATLEVTVTGLDPASGTVEVTVFNSAESFMKEPFLQQSAAIDGETQHVFTFSSLLDGEYALVVVHDENDNKVLDTGFLGFGGESIGYSNDAGPWLGRPSFEAARIEVGSEDQSITIWLD